VYVLSWRGEDGRIHVKIGHSSVGAGDDITPAVNRIRQLQTSSPMQIDVWGVFILAAQSPSAPLLEREARARLHEHYRDEWEPAKGEWSTYRLSLPPRSAAPLLAIERIIQTTAERHGIVIQRFLNADEYNREVAAATESQRRKKRSD
jgi:hypothetical protein